MIKKTIRQKSLMKILFYLVISLFILNFMIIPLYAEPVGPTIEVLGNTSKSAAASTKVNSTNGSQSPGGYIFTLAIDSRQQNTRWKAYVGNVTGTFALDDANDFTFYEWSLTSIAGEVYATRASGDVNWSGINCTWVADGKKNGTEGYEDSNRTPEHDENKFLSHTSKDDNVTSTFISTSHTNITIGAVIIGKDECFTIQTWQRDTVQVFDDSENANFTEIILYDGAFNKTDGNVVYATFIENDITGYTTAETYDFQVMVPEDGSTGFSGSTAYYFYVELS